MFGAQIIQQQWEIKKIFNLKQTLTHSHKTYKIILQCTLELSNRIKSLERNKRKALVDGKEAENCFQNFISAKLLWPLALFSLKNIQKKRSEFNGIKKKK